MFKKAANIFNSYASLITFLFLASCGGNEEPTIDQAAIDDMIISDYIAANNITATKDVSGIYYEELVTNQTGKEQTPVDNILTIYYTAKVLDGNIIELNSRGVGLDSIKVRQGVGAIFPVGLDIGLAYMQKGESFRFFIPSNLAYNDFSFASVIPVNSVIEIEVELVEIENELDQLTGEKNLIDNYIINQDLNNTVDNPLDPVQLLSSCVYYKRLAAGAVNDTLLSGENVNIQYSGTFLDDPNVHFTNGTLDYNFNTGIVIPGIDSALFQMERGERALIIIPSQSAYKESAMFIPRNLGNEFINESIIPSYANDVPPFSVLVFDLILQ